MKRYFLLLFVLMALNGFGQKMGSFTYTLNVTNGIGGTVTANEPQPYTKYTNYSTYWFVKPNGDRYLFINGGKNLGIVILHNRVNDTDITYQDKFIGDQLLLQGTLRGTGFTCYPDNSKGPVHIHYNIFTAGEVEFTFSGPVTFATGTSNSSYVKGNINGTVHLYRDPQYEKSAAAPNCNCDPTIYAFVYGPEVGRTPSACENAVLWRVYNALHPALNPVLNMVSATQNLGENGQLIYRQDKSMVDVTEPVEPVEACNPDNKRRGIVSIDAQNRMFTVDNYALNFIQMTNTDKFIDKSVDYKAIVLRSMAIQDSIMKLVAAKKMSNDEASRQINEKMKALQPASKTPDIHQAEVYSHLDVTAKVNIGEWHVSDMANAEIQHNVPGAAFEIYRPSMKDGDGNWVPFKKVVFYGKFNIVKTGARISKIVAVADPKATKLTIFNAMIEVSGGQGLVDQAMATINFSPILAMFNNN